MLPIAHGRRLQQVLRNCGEQDVETVCQAFSDLDVGRAGGQTFT